MPPKRMAEHSQLFCLPTCCCKKFVQCREISREMIKMNNPLMCAKLTRPPLSWPINYQTIISCTNKTACKQGIFFTKLCKPWQNENLSPGLWSCLPEMTTQGYCLCSFSGNRMSRPPRRPTKSASSDGLRAEISDGQPAPSPVT